MAFEHSEKTDRDTLIEQSIILKLDVYSNRIIKTAIII